MICFWVKNLPSSTQSLTTKILGNEQFEQHEHDEPDEHGEHEHGDYEQ